MKKLKCWTKKYSLFMEELGLLYCPIYLSGRRESNLENFKKLLFAVSWMERILKFQRTSPINWWNYHTLLICLYIDSPWNFGRSSNKTECHCLLKNFGHFSFIFFFPLFPIYLLCHNKSKTRHHYVSFMCLDEVMRQWNIFGWLILMGVFLSLLLRKNSITATAGFTLRKNFLC